MNWLGISSVKRAMTNFLDRRAVSLCLGAVLLVACGSRGPSPVGLSLLEQSFGQTIELPPGPPAAARTNFDGLNSFVLGTAGELFIGRMHGVAYRSLFRARFDSAGVGIQAEDLVGAEVVLSLVTSGQLGQGGIGLLSSLTDWSEETAFVDSMSQEIPFQLSSESQRLVETRVDSVVTLTLPLSLIQSALISGSPDVSFVLGPAEASLENFLIIVGSREFGLDGNGTADEAAIARRPFLRLIDSNNNPIEIPLSEDTYFGQREAAVPDGTLLLQAGIARSVRLLFDFPTIPADATINFVELTADIVQDVSLSDGIDVNIRRVDIDETGQDTTFVRVQDAFSTFTASGSSTVVVFPIDHLIVQTWISGVSANEGIALFPLFEGRYEWLEMTNPTLRLIYTIPPGDNG